VVEDLNSTNGIYVKSSRVRRHYLNDGDVVLVGKHELIYVDERAARGRSITSDTIPKLPALTDIPELHAAPAGEADQPPADPHPEKAADQGAEKAGEKAEAR
jgi:pSer/pThr/pTyr-binding forkhead associated (FHA) protein